MIIRPFRDWRIRTKLISATLLLVLLPLLCVAYLALDRFGKALRSAAEEDLGHLVGNIYSMCKIQHEMVRMRAISTPGRAGDKHAKVIGALSAGVKEETTPSFKDEIKNIKVGHTGYVYIIDRKGTLKLHPAKEGENILHSKDSAGFEYIRAMIMHALELGDGAVGTIRYPWVNPELGEKRPRQKINKYIYFRPWDWIIAAGSYEEEIYQSMYETERFILIAVIAGLALVLLLTFTLSKVLTRPIQDLTRITTKMVDGDLSQRVKVRSADEIGLLGTAFNRMIGQVQDYTTILEKMVEERTQELRNRVRDIVSFPNF